MTARIRFVFAALAAPLCTLWIPTAPARAGQLAATRIWSGASVGAGAKYVACDSSGTVYVCNDSTNSTYGKRLFGFRFDAPDGSSPSATRGPFSTTSGYPRVVAVDPQTQTVYLQDDGALCQLAPDWTTHKFSLAGVTAPSPASPYQFVQAMRFSPDGNYLFVDCSSVLIPGSIAETSIVRVLRRNGPGLHAWTDTGRIIAPPNNTVAKADADVRNNQGRSCGLAVTANGSVWVAGATDPVLWNGTALTATYGAYARPLRLYVPEPEPDGSYVLTAEIPLDNRLMGLAVDGDGILYAAEGINTTIAGRPGTLAYSHRIYVYRGLGRAGYIDTGATLSDLQGLDVKPGSHDRIIAVTGTINSDAAVQKWRLDATLPALVKHAVQVRLTDARTGVPITNGVVRVYDQRVTANVDGVYATEAPDTGTAVIDNPGTLSVPDPYYIVSADAPGYARAQVAPVYVRGNVTLDIPLSRVGDYASVRLGPTNVGMGITLRNVADGDNTPVGTAFTNGAARVTGGNVTLADKANGNSVGDNRLYFDVDDGFLRGNDHTYNRVFATVRWDNNPVNALDWFVFYDAVDNASAKSPGLPRTEKSETLTTTVYMPDANFNNRMASGADFCVQGPDGAPIAVHSVSVTKALPPAAKAARPPGWDPSNTANPASGIQLLGFLGTPTVFDGVVYAAIRGDGFGHFAAINVSDGTYREGFGDSGLAGRITLTGKMVGRPVIYMPLAGEAHIGLATDLGYIYSFRASDGALDWGGPIQPLGAGSTCANAPAVFMDTSTGTAVPILYVGINDATGGHLVRIIAGAAGPTVLGASQTFGDSITSSPAIGAGGSYVMVGFTDAAGGHLLITDNPRTATADFTPLRDFVVPGEPVLAPPSLSGDGRQMIIGTSDGTRGHVVAANPHTASIVWSVPTAGVEATPWVDYPPAPRAAEATTVYVGTLDGTIHALDIASGAEEPNWPLRPVDTPVGGSLMTIGENLYVGSEIGLLVMNKANPHDVRMLPDLSSATGPVVVPGMNRGFSASGRTTSDILVATGSNGTLQAFYVQENLPSE